MNIKFTSRHFKSHDTLKEHAESEINKIDRFYDGLTKAEVILSFEKSTNSVKTAEVIISSNAHHVFTARAKSDDFKVSIDSAINKIIKQIKKHKEKIKSSGSHRI